MSIIRTKRKKHNFTIIDNTGLIDPDLTWKETGLLAFLMTKPDDWEVSIKSLTNNKQDKRDSVATAISGLQQKGYVYRKDFRDEKGRFKVEYLVFETKEDLQTWLKENPQNPDEQTGTGKPKRENRNGKTVTGKPERTNRNGRTVTGKPDQVITDIDITDQQITELVITEREGAHAIAQTLTPTVQVFTTEPEPESSLEQTDFTVAQTPELPIEPITFPLGQNSPAPLAKAETTADRVRRVYQETGILPRIPAELEAWVQIDLGSEIVASYRKSGRITTTKRGDIQPSFASYVASQNKGKDIDFAYSYIRSLEKDPTKWETLAALVLKWQAATETGNRRINISQKVEAEVWKEETKRKTGVNSGDWCSK